MKNKKYFPIGTVLSLKNSTKRVMIIGFCAIADENNKKIYDYSGCLYPEGLISSNQILLFDHNQIDKVYHAGLICKEEEEFKQKLDKITNNQ